jgi:hypothetical protein
LKELAVAESKKICDEIEDLIKSYEKTVIEAIEAPIPNGDKIYKLYRKDNNNYSPKDSNDNFYYRSNVLETIFIKAIEYPEKGEDSYTIPDPHEVSHTVKGSTFRIMTLGTGLKSLGYGNAIVMRELQLRCHQIIPDTGTQNIVKNIKN